MRQRPDVVVSDINSDPNLSNDNTYLGIMKTFYSVRHLGYPTLQVSLNGYTHYDTAASLTCSILRAFDCKSLHTRYIFNIDAPDLPFRYKKSINATRWKSRYTEDKIISQQYQFDTSPYWIRPLKNEHDARLNNDFFTTDEGHISATPLHVNLIAHNAQDDVVLDWLERARVNTQW